MDVRWKRDMEEKQGHKWEKDTNADRRGTFTRAKERVTDCQGKHISDQIRNITEEATRVAMVQDNKMAHSSDTSGLEPPQLNGVDCAMVGDDKKRLRK